MFDAQLRFGHFAHVLQKPVDPWHFIRTEAAVVRNHAKSPPGGGSESDRC